MFLLPAASPGWDVSSCSSESRLRRKSLFTVTFLATVNIGAVYGVKVAYCAEEGLEKGPAEH